VYGHDLRMDLFALFLVQGFLLVPLQHGELAQSSRSWFASAFMEGVKHAGGVVLQLGRARLEVLVGGEGGRRGQQVAGAQLAVPAAQPLHAW
jgi:hypothetical protein